MTRLPNNPAPMLTCKLCGNGLFLGNNHGACYPCMAVTGRKDIGEEEHLTWSLMYLLDGHNQKAERIKAKILSRCDTHKNELSIELQQMLDNVLAGRRPKDNASYPTLNGKFNAQALPKAAPAPVPQAAPSAPVPSENKNILDAIDKFLSDTKESGKGLTLPEMHGHVDPPAHENQEQACTKCEGMGKDGDNPCDWCKGTGQRRASVNCPILHTDIHDHPHEWEYKRAGDTECSVCHKPYSMHQLHQFGTGAFPLLLRRICDQPESTVRYVKL